MRCEDCKEMLSAWVDGELGEVEIAQAREHIAQCPDCAADLEAFREISAMYRDLESAPAPGDFEARVWSRLGETKTAEASKPSAPSNAPKSSRTRQWLGLPLLTGSRLALAGAVAVFLCAVLLTRETWKASETKSTPASPLSEGPGVRSLKVIGDGNKTDEGRYRDSEMIERPKTKPAPGGKTEEIIAARDDRAMGMGITRDSGQIERDKAGIAIPGQNREREQALRIGEPEVRGAVPAAEPMALIATPAERKEAAASARAHVADELRDSAQPNQAAQSKPMRRPADSPVPPAVGERAMAARIMPAAPDQRPEFERFIATGASSSRVSSRAELTIQSVQWTRRASDGKTRLRVVCRARPLSGVKKDEASTSPLKARLQIQGELASGLSEARSGAPTSGATAAFVDLGEFEFAPPSPEAPDGEALTVIEIPVDRERIGVVGPFSVRLMPVE